ncbi:MAG: hypothetical protein JJ974_06205 [Phycisphaerales bacterium]|nr:hypothetical protein [Phycisphaerales bacterium]
MKSFIPSMLALTSGICLAQNCDWVLETTPNPEGNVMLFGIDGNSTDTIWTVGEQYIFDFPVQFDSYNYIARWDGSSWSQSEAPQPSTLRISQNLSDVLSIDNNDAIAVGTYNPDSGPSLAQSMRWDGSSWELMQSPVITGGCAFRAIGKAGDDIWACGSKFSELPPPAASGYPLAARLNGDEWEVFFVPPLAETGGRSFNHIRAIEGASEDDAWAGGTAQDTGFGFGPAAMMIRWDGSQWSQYDLRDTVQSFNFSSVESIEVLTSDDAWAAGYDYDIDRQVTMPLILHWDGNTWSNIPVPIFEHSAELRAITARSSDDIYASGTKTFGDGYPHALILHWDGNEWTEVPESNLTDYGTWFRAMATVEGELWSAGQSNDLSPGITQRQEECSSECMPDLNRDGVLDFFDVSAFLTAYSAREQIADITSSGTWDFFDVSAFLGAFATGCP